MFFGTQMNTDTFFIKKPSNLCISVGIRVLYQQQIYHTNKQAGVANIKISYEKH
jgi:uncharacterized SAM-binding protein YcdF (DUF218 family)